MVTRQFSKTFLLGSFLLLTAVFNGPALADDKQEAVALVKKAVELHKAKGKNALISEINQPNSQFRHGDIYVFAYEMNGTVAAHPVNPRLVGKNLINVPDSHGKLFRKEIIDGAKNKGSGWVDYQYTNPETKKVEEKTTYFEKSDDLVLGSGVYK